MTKTYNEKILECMKSGLEVSTISNKPNISKKAYSQIEEIKSTVWNVAREASNSITYQIPARSDNMTKWQSYVYDIQYG